MRLVNNLLHTGSNCYVHLKMVISSFLKTKLNFSYLVLLMFGLSIMIISCVNDDNDTPRSTTDIRDTLQITDHDKDSLIDVIVKDKDSLSSMVDEIDTLHPIHIGGVVQKGPLVSGSLVLIQGLNEDFTLGGEVYHLNTPDDLGSFTFEKLVSTPYIEIIAKGYYFNEVTGRTSSSRLTLRSLVKVQNELVTNINILTTLSKNRLIHLIESEGMSYEGAKLQVSKELLTVFRISTEGLDFGLMDMSLSNEESAILIAVSSIIQGYYQAPELSEFLSKFDDDFTDNGKIDSQDILDQLKNSSKVLKPSSIESNLKERYNSLGKNVEIPDLEKYVGRLVDLEVLSIYVQGEQRDLLRDAEIWMAFNKALDETTIKNGGITISLNDEAVSGDYVYYEDGYKVSFIPNDLFAPSSTYNITVSNSLKAKDGVTLSSEFNFQFTTNSLDVVNDLTNHYVFNGSSQDISGNGYHGVLEKVSYIWDINGVSNQAILFKGNGYYVDLPRSINPVQSEWTFSIWFKLDQLPSNRDDAFLLTRKEHDNESDIYLYVDNDDNMIKTGIASNKSKVSSGFSVKKDVWYHAAMTYSSDKLSIYVNGEQKTTSYKRFSSSNKSNEPFRIACDYLEGWYGYDEYKGRIFGSVDNIRLYSRVLNGQEVAHLFDLEKSTVTNASRRIANNKISSTRTTSVVNKSWP